MNITEESNQMTLDKQIDLMVSMLNQQITLKDLSINELKELKDKIDIEIYRKSR